MKIAIVRGDDTATDECELLDAALDARGEHVTTHVRDVGPRAPRAAEEALPFVGEWSAELEHLWSPDPPDVVHAHGWLGGLAAQLAARRLQLPTVQSFRGLAPAGPHPSTARGRLEPLLARNARWVTGGSSSEVDVLARIRRGRARLSLLPAGVDVRRYTPVERAPIRPDRPRILCMASNPLPYNGFDIAIRALPRLHGMELVLAETEATDHRNDKARTELRRLAEGLGVSDRVRFLGAVVADEQPALLQSAYVVLCAPRESPRATTALQAMASGVAVVAVTTGALPDVVVHSVTGLLVPPDDPDQLVDALKVFQSQHFQSESMGAAGRSRAQSRFSWDRIALDAANIYHQITTQEFESRPAHENVRSTATRH